MIDIFVLMVLVGGFCFIGFGICSANPIKAKESEVALNIMVGLTALGALAFTVGFIGLVIMMVLE